MWFTPTLDFNTQTITLFANGYDLNYQTIYIFRGAINYIIVYSENGTGLTSYSMAMNNNSWYNLVFTKDGGDMKIFLNGNLVTNLYYTPFFIYPNNSNFNLGTSINNGFSNFKGIIDDVQIYKGALTDGQVRALYQNQTACYDATTYVCLSNATYNSMLSGQQVLQVSNQIVGNSTIQSNANIYFDSKNSVLLQPGFKTEANTVFKATVGGGCL